jgi:heterodisulfide reductase subunit D
MTAYSDQLDTLAASALERCTTCGRCAQACPTAKETGIDAGDGIAMVRGLQALTADGAAETEARRWLEACNNSGQCSLACPEGINVRQWVSIARMKMVAATKPEAARQTGAAQRFRTMAQAVRLIASMQLPSETLTRILAPAERRKAEVLFYTGCNVLKTPHIVLNVMDIMDVLGVDYDVVGGPSHCCGVYQFLEADLPTYEKIGHRTFDRFGQSGAKEVLTWCPTCTKNFDELEADAAPPSFDLGHVSRFLASRLDDLRPHFVEQPPRRAVIHEHQGIADTLESIRALMRAVPNLTLVEMPQDSGFSYACGGQAAKYAERERAIHSQVAEGAQAVGADLVITMYHSCHRALAGAEARYDFRVANFTDVLAEAVGRGGRADYFKQYKVGGDMQQAVDAARRFLASNGVKLDPATVDSLTAELFKETAISGSPEPFRQAFAALAAESAASSSRR